MEDGAFNNNRYYKKVKEHRTNKAAAKPGYW